MTSLNEKLLSIPATLKRFNDMADGMLAKEQDRQFREHSIGSWWYSENLRMVAERRVAERERA